MEDEQKLSKNVAEMAAHDAEQTGEKSVDVMTVDDAETELADNPEALAAFRAFQAGESFPTQEETQQAENESAFDTATSRVEAARFNADEELL